MCLKNAFTDLDAYQKAIACDMDMVLLCTPPGFRPMQFEAAVKAGKPFMEKPATDARECDYGRQRKRRKKSWPWPWAITCDTR